MEVSLVFDRDRESIRADNNTQERKRGKRGGKKRSARALRKARLLAGERGRPEEGTNPDHIVQDQEIWRKVELGAHERSVGARRSNVKTPEPSALVVPSPATSKGEETTTFERVMHQALELHPSLRPDLVPRVWLTKGIHEFSGLLHIQEPLILAGAPVIRFFHRLKGVTHGGV